MKTEAAFAVATAAGPKARTAAKAGVGVAKVEALGARWAEAPAVGTAKDEALAAAAACSVLGIYAWSCWL